jgi:hypothetical protein
MMENHEDYNCNNNRNSLTTSVCNVVIRLAKERRIMPGNSVYYIFLHYEDRTIPAFS